MTLSTPGKYEREILPWSGNGQTLALPRHAASGVAGAQDLHDIRPGGSQRACDRASPRLDARRQPPPVAIGFQTVGPGRQARQMAGDWQLLESVRWLIHLESGKLVPVVGSNAIRMFKRCCPQTPDAR